MHRNTDLTRFWLLCQSSTDRTSCIQNHKRGEAGGGGGGGRSYLELRELGEVRSSRSHRLQRHPRLLHDGKAAQCLSTLGFASLALLVRENSASAVQSISLLHYQYMSGSTLL